MLPGEGHILADCEFFAQDGQVFKRVFQKDYCVVHQDDFGAGPVSSIQRRITGKLQCIFDLRPAREPDFLMGI